MLANSSESERGASGSAADREAASEPERSSAGVPECFGRNVDLYGDDGFARIQRGYVAVIGLGGVGSHCAVNLARSGVGRLLIVDFDRLTASSLNRNPIAGPDDVGRLKADVLADHLRCTCAETTVAVSHAFCHTETLPDLLRPGGSDTPNAPDTPASFDVPDIPASFSVPNLVIDAIDSLNPKVTLLTYCVQEQIPVLSSMGAAGRRDPTRVRVADLADTRRCPLARQVRKRLRRRGVDGGITCVFSTEPPAPPREPDLGDRTYDRGRVRSRLPSQMSLPGIFGYTLASLALDWLAGGAALPSASDSGRDDA